MRWYQKIQLLGLVGGVLFLSGCSWSQGYWPLSSQLETDGNSSGCVPIDVFMDQGDAYATTLEYENFRNMFFIEWARGVRRERGHDFTGAMQNAKIPAWNATELAYADYLREQGREVLPFSYTGTCLLIEKKKNPSFFGGPPGLTNFGDYEWKEEMKGEKIMNIEDLEDWYQKCFAQLYLEKFVTFDDEELTSFKSSDYLDNSWWGDYFLSYLISPIGDIKGWYILDKLFPDEHNGLCNVY